MPSHTFRRNSSVLNFQVALVKVSLLLCLHWIVVKMCFFALTIRSMFVFRDVTCFLCLRNHSTATSSSSLAVSMAAAGHKVALISTDPAHSLGDALDVDLAGGNLVDVPLIGVPGATGEGSLSALEIDPSSAIGQFKGLVDKLIGGGKDAEGMGEGSELKSTLQELESVFDTLPAGTDEVVALAKVRMVNVELFVFCGIL